MAMEVCYCNHSRQAIMYQYIMLNADRYSSFDKLYDNMVNAIKQSGNGKLIQSIPNQKLLKEGKEIYDNAEN